MKFKGDIKMKTPIKPAVNLKRVFLIVLMSMFVIVGIQSQKSVRYSFYSDSNILKELFANLQIFNLQDEILEYGYSPVINEPNYKVYALADNIVLTIEVLTDANTANMNTLKEENEEEMEVECWMLNDFHVKPCKSDKSLDEETGKEEAEEDMEIEDWMLNMDRWAVAEN
jgi:hypothetical protein